MLISHYDHGLFDVMITSFRPWSDGMLDAELLARFDAKVSKEVDGCWLWTGAKSKAGYGQIRATRQRLTLYAHNIAYRRWVSEVPEGMEVCHRCDVRHCVRPDHLFAGTRYDNLRDMVNKDRHVRGERTCNAVLTDDLAREILRRAGSVSNRTLARSIGVSRSTVDRVIHGTTWKHIQ
jgi:hypothetical protein